MKTKYYTIKFFTYFLTSAAFIFTSIAYAKNVTMYEQPQADAKVVGTADLTTGIIPIFTPKPGDWIKIADPRNGNVGWVKSNELTDSGTFTYTQRIINDGKGAQTYQIIEYGKPQNLSTEQVQGMIKKMQPPQSESQEAMQKSVLDIMKDMGTMYQKQMDNMQKAGVPIIMPIVIMPQQKGEVKKQN